MRPVRTSSLTPCGPDELLEGRRADSGGPTTSKIIASGPRSATWASKTSASAMQLAAGARRARCTLISASSRSTASPGSSSLTRRTFTSLCICFSICSSECCSQSTRSVIRETSGRSVGPDREALDVEAAPGEHVRDARERARLVLDEDGERVAHAVVDRLPRSGILDACRAAAAPAGIIGKHFSSGSTARVDDGRAPAGRAPPRAARTRARSSSSDGEAGARRRPRRAARSRAPGA